MGSQGASSITKRVVSFSVFIFCWIVIPLTRSGSFPTFGGSAALRVVVRLKFHWGDSPDGGRFTRACVKRFSCFCFHSVTFPCSVLGDSGLRSDRWGVFTVTHLSLCCHLLPFALFLFINRLHGLDGLSYSD